MKIEHDFVIAGAWRDKKFAEYTVDVHWLQSDIIGNFESSATFIQNGAFLLNWKPAQRRFVLQK